MLRKNIYLIKHYILFLNKYLLSLAQMQNMKPRTPHLKYCTLVLHHSLRSGNNHVMMSGTITEQFLVLGQK